MNWLDRLERRFGAWAIPQFALFIVMANGLIFLLTQIRPEFVYMLLLDPEAIRQGQFWRVITFLFVPPAMGFWTLLWLLVLYQFALALEHEWGDFRFCLFYAIGALAMIVTALWIVGETLSNVPLNTTLFLAFAALYPNMELYLFFVIPVKVKYLAALTWLWLLVALILGSMATRITIAASLLNFAIFFGPQIGRNIRLRWDVYRNRRRFNG